MARENILLYIKLSLIFIFNTILFGENANNSNLMKNDYYYNYALKKVDLLQPRNGFFYRKLQNQVVASRLQKDSVHFPDKTWECLLVAYTEFKKNKQNIRDYYALFEEFDELENTFTVKFMFAPLKGGFLQEHYYYPVYSYYVTKNKILFQSFHLIRKPELINKILYIKKSKKSSHDKLEKKLLYENPYYLNDKYPELSDKDRSIILRQAMILHDNRIENIGFPAWLLAYIEIAFNDYKKLLSPEKYYFSISCSSINSKIQVFIGRQNEIDPASGFLLQFYSSVIIYRISIRNMKIEETKGVR